MFLQQGVVVNSWQISQRSFLNFRSSWADQMDEFDLKESSSKADKAEVNGDKSKAKRKREAKHRRRKNKQEVRTSSLRAELHRANATAKANFCFDICHYSRYITCVVLGFLDNLLGSDVDFRIRVRTVYRNLKGWLHWTIKFLVNYNMFATLEGDDDYRQRKFRFARCNRSVWKDR